jgi:hypothetical protein
MKSFLTFFYQMVLGYELKLRLERDNTRLDNLTEDVIATVH